jgi:hypothetical protein
VFETKRCAKAVPQWIERRRPPPHLRGEIDLTFRMEHQSVEIFEVRANWRDKSKRVSMLPRCGHTCFDERASETPRRFGTNRYFRNDPM